MANPTRFDFHVVNFMNSEDVERMTSDEVGQYVLLLCKAWLIGKNTTLPDDPKYLATQARCKQVSSLVMKKFPLVNTPEGPRRQNEILYGEWMLALDRQASASERGKRGNETRYSENNGDSNSETIATAQAKTCNSPIPYHSNSYQSVPNQTNSSISFTGGSFGQGEYKNISRRWYSLFQKTLQKSKLNKEQYANACNTYNEDVVLDYLETWAKENQWVSAHPKGGNRLYVFLQALPEMVEGDQLRVARETEQKQKDGPVISENDVTTAMERDRAEKLKQIERDKELAAQQKKFEEENRDAI